MCFFFDVILVGCSSIFVYVITLSPGQYSTIFLIVYRFCIGIGIEPSYLDQKGKCCRDLFCQ